MMSWLLPFLGLMAAGGDDQWAQFRGPNGSGVDSAAGYPVEFSPRKNVVWKTAIPYGQSSPVVVGGRVYLTAAESTRLLTICLDAKNRRSVVAAGNPAQGPKDLPCQRSSIAHSGR